MSKIYNVYCDESCHLENDRKEIMVLGAIWTPTEYVRNIFKEIRNIKQQYGLNKNFEIKWTKVSPAKLEFYKELIKYFFNKNALHFRALIALEKDRLHHNHFHQDHDTWYFKMYFNMLKVIFEPDAKYRIYLDIKDTCSNQKIEKLHNVLCNNIYDFSREIIQRLQSVRSHEVEILQLVDLLIGAISYVNRGLNTSNAKLSLIDYIKRLSGYSLKATTLVRENKFNLFFWKPEEIAEQ
ncbi:MAG: DUF3800 domain-containing protein [Promethearchaeota archaeon]